MNALPLPLVVSAARAEDELRLLRRFLDRSVKNTRPVNDTLDAVRVVLDITLHSVVDMVGDRNGFDYYGPIVSRSL